MPGQGNYWDYLILGRVLRPHQGDTCLLYTSLLKNAAAYSYPNTEIIITAKRCGNSVQMNFEDHGRTIEPEQISGIFEKFNRLDEARLSDTGGTGLGLSIAEGITRLHLSLIHIS